jgi:sec-independent protein translocase protein TatB
MNFLGVGPGEVLLIFILLLVVVGPERLPGLARSLGRNLVRVRNWMQTSPDAALVLRARQEIEQELAQLRLNLLEVQNVRDEVIGVAKQIDDAVSPIANIKPPSISDLLKPPAEPTIAAGSTSQAAALAAEETAADPVLVDPAGNPLVDTTPAEDAASDAAPEQAPLPNGVQNGMIHDEAAHDGADRPPTAAEIETLGLRIQAVMADLFALQEQLKQRGLLADSWNPPSHTMQMPQPDAPVEEANR